MARGLPRRIGNMNMWSSWRESGSGGECPRHAYFWHVEKEIRAVIHGDDFTLLGREGDLDWFREQIQEKFDVKSRGRLGPGRGDDKCVRIRN